MRATPDVTRATPTHARRRRERMTRSFFRHEQMAFKMAVISAQHHSAQRCCSIATQTDDYVAASSTYFNMSDSDDSDAPASPVTEYVAPAPDITCTAPAPAIEYVPAGTEPIEHVSFAPHDTYAAPAPVTEHVAPTSAVTFASPCVRNECRAVCLHDQVSRD